MRPEPDLSFAVDPTGYRPRPRRLVGVGTILTVLAVFGFAGATVYIYGGSSRPAPSSGVPVIEADPAPTKTKREQPIPAKDKEIYDRIRNIKTGPTVERLLPPPEEPLPRPIVAPELPDPPALVTPPVVATTARESRPPAVEPVPTALVPAIEPRPEPAAKPIAIEPPKPAPPAASAPTPPSSAATAGAAPGTLAAPAGASAGAGATWRLQFASVRTEEEAKAEWQRLVSRYREDLAGLSPVVLKADLGDRGVFWRVQGAGATEERAKAICARLRSQNVGCLVVRP